MADEKEEKPANSKPNAPVNDSPDNLDDDDFDVITADEARNYEPDGSCAIVIDEEIYVDLHDKGELIEEYWEKGWITRYYGFTRANFDAYNDRYFKVFPTRYKLDEFTFTKSLRRVLNKNKDLKSIVRPLRITDAKEKLYVGYQAARYNQTPRSSLAQCYDFIKYFPSDLTELCVFKDERLIACTILEVGNDSVVSNICFWDLSESRRGLGMLTVLLEIKYALSRNMKYYYLGHYYKQNPRYQYKARFGGLELFNWETFSWVDFKHSLAKEMLDQKLPRHKS